MLTTPRDFAVLTGLSASQYPWLDEAAAIVRLAEIKEITSVTPMSCSYMEAILNSVSYGLPVILGLAYQGKRIELTEVLTSDLEISQGFVQRDKLEFFKKTFPDHFLLRQLGFNASSCGPLIVTGRNGCAETLVGHYLPPIVEEHRERLYLLEGMHRCFTSHQATAPQTSIVVRNVEAPFPWVTKAWGNVHVVSEKPPPHERKFGGSPALFRHFAPVGIDT